MNTSELKSLYNELRQFKTPIIDEKKIAGKLPADVSVGKLNQVLGLISRFAKNTNEEEFVKLVNSEFKDVPAIPLTKQEQELIKGGRTIFYYIGWILGAACDGASHIHG